MKMRQVFTKTVSAALLCVSAFAVKASEKDIVATASTYSFFSTLLNAVEVADLTGALQSDGPFTVFAPINDAFEQLPQGQLDELLKPENKDRLVAVLSYHVVPGEYTADMISGKQQQLETLGGEPLLVDAAGRVAKVDHAAIQTPDVMASNGVIHVIDHVLIPQ